MQDWTKDPVNLVFCFHPRSNVDAWGTRWTYMVLPCLSYPSAFGSSGDSWTRLGSWALSRPVTDCMKTISFVLNLSSLCSIWCLFVLVVEETVNNQSVSTLSCHSLVYIPQASLFSVWRIPIYLILPSTGVVPITLTSLLTFYEPFQFSYILWNAGTRTACRIQRWEMVLCCVLSSFPHNF